MTKTNSCIKTITKLSAAALVCAGFGSGSFQIVRPERANAAPVPSENAKAVSRTITVGVAQGFTTLDPYNASDALSRTVAKSFYEGLFTLDRNLKVVPQLATGYEVSDDGLVYTIKLREGVKFSDGEDFNAEAVKINIERMLNPDNKLSRRSQFDSIKSVEVVASLTVKMTLKRPFSPIISRLAANTMQMVCPNSIKSGSNIAFEPCGTGPFLMKEYNPSEKLIVVKNPNYWQKGLPKVDGINWIPVVENATRVAMLRTGEADIIQPMPVEMIKEVKNLPDIDVLVQPSVTMRYMIMNNLAKPFDNPTVRKAINYAINKEALAKVAFAGYARPATGVIPAQIEYAQKIGPWEYNPQKARELLKKAGFPNGFETTLWSGYNDSTSQKVIQVLQQQLAQVGIKVTLQALEAGQRVSMVESIKNPEDAKSKLYYIGWNSSLDIDWALRPIFESKNCPPVLANEGYYANELVDKLLDQGIATTDPEKRAPIYKKIQETIWNDAPWAWLVFEDTTSAKRKNLQDFFPKANNDYDFYGAYVAE